MAIAAAVVVFNNGAPVGVDRALRRVLLAAWSTNLLPGSGAGCGEW